MAYREFATDRADYLLELTSHSRKNRYATDIFAGIDALVMETGASTLQTLIRTCDDPEFRDTYPHIAHAVSAAKEKRIPLFGTDVPLTVEGMVRHERTNLPPMGIMRWVASAWAIDDGPMHQDDAAWISRWTRIFQSPCVTGRDAINARKIEQWVAPYLQEMLDKDRPRIGMTFGYMHVGIEQDILRQSRRDLTLWNWRTLNWGAYAGFDTSRLGIIDKAVFSQDAWRHTSYTTNLFP